MLDVGAISLPGVPTAAAARSQDGLRALRATALVLSPDIPDILEGIVQTQLPDWHLTLVLLCW